MDIPYAITVVWLYISLLFTFSHSPFILFVSYLISAHLDLVLYLSLSKTTLLTPTVLYSNGYMDSILCLCVTLLPLGAAAFHEAVSFINGTLSQALSLEDCFIYFVMVIYEKTLARAKITLIMGSYSV